MKVYPNGLDAFRSEFEVNGIILEVFDIQPLAQLVIIKDKATKKIYLLEYYYSAGNWEMGQTRLRSLETGVHLILHAVRYWQSEVKKDELALQSP